MRAVNLIPRDQRRGGGGGSGGRTGSAVYIVLGALGALVLATAVYTLTGNQVNSRKGEVAKASQEAATLEQQAAALKPYTQFATLSESRVQTVTSLADSRFNWERAMRDLARALPGDVWLTSLIGTVAPGVTLEGGGGGSTGSLRSAVKSPAIEMVGCTDSQSSVSRVMARLRIMRGVQRVSLASSEKAEGAAGPAAAAERTPPTVATAAATFPNSSSWSSSTRPRARRRRPVRPGPRRRGPRRRPPSRLPTGADRDPA